MTDALVVDLAEARMKPATFDYFGQTWEVRRKPNTLLLSELARTDSGDVEAFGVIAEFLEYVLGDQYKAFKKLYYAADEDTDTMGELIRVVLEVSMGRPTV